MINLRKGDRISSTRMWRPARSRAFGFSLMVLLLAVVACEGLSRLLGPLVGHLLGGIDLRTTVEIYQAQKESIRVILERETNDIWDPDLGWRYRPNFRSRRYNNNSAGIRGLTEYARVPQNGVLRIAAFGDSFVYGSEVTDHEAWPALLGATLPKVEVLNFGVGGYGTDQAYLMYEKFGKKFGAQVVLIGFTPVQVARNVNVYRRFYSPHDMAFAKPRFLPLPDGDLELLPCPIRTEDEYHAYYRDPSAVTALGTFDYWYSAMIYENPLYDYSATIRLASQAIPRLRRNLVSRWNIVLNGRLNPDSEPLQITMSILRLFARRVTAEGARPLILLFPGIETVRGKDGAKVRVYEAVAEHLRKEGLEFLDLARAFDAAPDGLKDEDYFMPGRHYSPYSNLLAAKAIAAYLAR